MKHTVRLILLVFCLLLTGCTLALDEDSIRQAEDVMKVTLLKVGKADAIILEYQEYTALIDTGEEDDAEKILKYLEKEETEKIDLLIISHYDKDHVGSADSVIEKYGAERVILPDYESSSTDYTDFMDALRQKGIEPEYPHETAEVNLGNMTFLIEPPSSYEIPNAIADYDNNFSLIVTVIHGENRLVFTGDAEKQRLREWLNTNPPECDFLKIPHHGVYSTELENLMKTLNPKLAAICDSKKNPADASSIEVIRKYVRDVMETKDGNIILLSKGRTLEMRQK